MLEEAMDILWCGTGAHLGDRVVELPQPGALVRRGQRTGLIASISVVAYLAFGIPAILAGVALTASACTRLRTGSGPVVMALAATKAKAIRRRHAVPVLGPRVSADHGR